MTGKDILMALNDIDEKYIQAAEFGAEPIQFKEKKSAPSRKLGKILLLAAALSLFLTGCAYAVFKVQDMMYEKVPVTVSFDDNGEHIEPTEKILERYTPFSLTDGPIAKATKEWNDFLDSYNMGNVDMETASRTIPENYYHTYECFTQEMVDKLEAILKKNNLKPLDKWLSPILQEDFNMLYDAYGIDGLLRPGAQADIKPTQGQFNSCGDFEVLNHIILTGADAIYKEHWSCFFDYAKKDVFWERMGSSIEGEYQQWNYTTADGTEVLLILRDNGNADIHADVGDAVIYMTIFPGEIGGDEEIEIPPKISSKEALEQIANIFDYHMKPHPFNRAEVELQLDASLHSLPKPKEPTWPGYAEVMKEINGQNLPEKQFYALYDINGDGVEDLLVGKGDGSFSEAYTLKDGKAKFLQHPYNHCYWVCENNSVEANTFDPDYDQVIRHYMAGTDLALVEEDMLICQNGQWHRGRFWDNVVSAEEAQSVMDKYPHVTLEFKPAKDYPG